MVDITILAWVYGAGVLAAAPLGPVNTVAIRRGLISRPARTLWVGLGSVFVEAGYVAAALWGAEELAGRIPEQAIRRWGGLPAAAVILLLGVFILGKAFVNARRLMASVRLERMRGLSRTPLRDFLTGAALTVINPLTLLYWIVVIGPNWAKMAQTAAVGAGTWYGLSAAVAGLLSWFVFLTAVVRLRPQQVGVRFFRVVNLLCGLALVALGLVLGVKAMP